MVADSLEKSAALLLRRHAGGNLNGEDLAGVGDTGGVSTIEAAMEDASSMAFDLCPAPRASDLQGSTASVPQDLGVCAGGGEAMLPPDALQSSYLNFGGQAELFEFDAAQRGLGNAGLNFL